MFEIERWAADCEVEILCINVHYMCDVSDMHSRLTFFCCHFGEQAEGIKRNPPVCNTKSASTSRSNHKSKVALAMGFISRPFVGLKIVPVSLKVYISASLV